jgi:hypothetical protein
MAMLMHQGQLPAEFTVDDRFQVTETHAQAPTPQKVLTTGGENEIVFDPVDEPVVEEVVRLPMHLESASWEKEYKARYDELVQKEALETITDKELKELDLLQKKRRRMVSPPSSAEIIARHRREKLDRELKAVLQRYVRLTPFPKNRA